MSGPRGRSNLIGAGCYPRELTLRSLFRPYLALAAVCLFWGTTFLAIRMSLESFPPLVLISARYVISGAIMLGFALARRLYMPRGRELAAACLSGFLVLGIGNGGLGFAEVLIPSGVASLIITIQPFWMVGVEALLPGGERLHAPTIGGMAVGLAGAALLFTPEPGTHFNRGLLEGFLILQFAMAAWSFGSIYQLRKAGRAHPVIAGAVQQLAAGLILAPFALVIPQAPIHWTVRGWGPCCTWWFSDPSSATAPTCMPWTGSRWPLFPSTPM